MNLQQVRQALADELNSLDARRARLQTAIEALGGVQGGGAASAESGRRKPEFTKAGLARVAAAHRARWAKLKAMEK